MCDEKVLERIWDESYPISAGHHLWPDTVVPMVAYAARFFRRGATTLDLPCGDGKNIFALSGIGPVIAADWSERAVSTCESRRRLARAPNIITMQADVFHMPFSSGTFENIFCCDLLGHLPNPIEALQELRRIVSPTGHVIVTLFTEHDSVLQDHRMERNQDGSYWFQGKWYFRFYSHADAREVCSTAGFRIYDIQEFSWIEPPHPGYREYEHEHSSWAVALQGIEA
jgi:ubiquinone/menaquinone biosynthesis C-methylase UbiE